jgi:hypothetical protein
MANLCYVLWICISNSVLLFSLFILEKFILLIPSQAKVPVPTILESVNTNQLGTFLLANILTGLINMQWNTFGASDGVALVIIVLYLVAVLGSAVLLRNLGLKLKL